MTPETDSLRWKMLLITESGSIVFINYECMAGPYVLYINDQRHAVDAERLNSISSCAICINTISEKKYK